jgi:hypothetical protein
MPTQNKTELQFWSKGWNPVIERHTTIGPYKAITAYVTKTVIVKFPSKRYYLQFLSEVNKKIIIINTGREL